MRRFGCVFAHHFLENVGQYNHEIFVRIVPHKAQKHQINAHAHADVSSENRGLKFGLSLYLHPNFVYAVSEGWLYGLFDPRYQ